MYFNAYIVKNYSILRLYFIYVISKTHILNDINIYFIYENIWKHMKIEKDNTQIYTVINRLCIKKYGLWKNMAYRFCCKNWKKRLS